MTTGDNKDKLDLAVRLLEHDSRLSDEEIRLLMQDPEIMRIYRDLEICRNTILRKSDPTPPDVDSEWSKFCRNNGLPIPTDDTPAIAPKRAPRHILWKISTGIAASLLLALIGLWYFMPGSDNEGILAFTAIDNEQSVTLRTGNGNTIDLSHETDITDLQNEEPIITKADIKELTYNCSETVTNIDTHLLSTSRGKDYKLTLEDGTTVWLNAESSLQYPTRFTGDTRHVTLKGEAYFKVAKNPDRPFIISTDRMDIQVLGTELNIKNYAPHDSHVTLVNGSVAVTDKRDKSRSVTLMPGQDAKWMDGESFDVSNVDTDIYVYWKDGYFYFDNKPLVDVMEELGRWYNFNVVFENKELMDMQVRFFCVRGQSSERAVELLNNMKRIYATLRDNTVYIR